MSYRIVFLVAAVSGAPVLNIPGVGRLSGTAETVHGVPVEAYLGIPYASSTRFSPPTKYPEWNGTREATQFGAMCPGATCRLSPGGVSENCLFLNLYKGASGSGPYPAMIFIHGGGYTEGCSDLYAGQQLVAAAKGKLVAVTFNYRLNIFGFLGGAAAKDPAGSTGNWGILDQRAAIEWVRNNAASIGVDISKVTIFGQSAGSSSVSVHMTSPLSQGLFKRAIGMSGFGAPFSCVTASTGEKSYRTVLSIVGCNNLECLKGKSTDELLQASSETTWGPVIDGVVLHKTPLEAVIAGEFDKAIDVMSGTTRGEMAYFLNKAPDIPKFAFEAQAEGLAPGHAQDVEALYNRSSFQYPTDLGSKNFWWWASMYVETDTVFTCPHRRFNRALLASGLKGNLFAYMLTRVTKSRTRIPATGPHATAVPHESDTVYVFECPDYPLENICVFDVEAEADLAKHIAGAWVTFASTGVPGQEWQQYSGTHDNHLLLDVSPAFNGTGFVSVDAVRKAQCDFWDKH